LEAYIQEQQVRRREILNESRKLPKLTPPISTTRVRPAAGLVNQGRILDYKGAGDLKICRLGKCGLRKQYGSFVSLYGLGSAALTEDIREYADSIYYTGP
jgi:hypothetical protein